MSFETSYTSKAVEGPVFYSTIGVLMFSYTILSIGVQLELGIWYVF